MSDDLLKSLWMQRMPPSVRGILQISNEDLQAVAKLADKVIEATGREQVYAATTTPVDSGQEIVERVNKLEKRIFSPSRSKRSSTRDKSPTLCWYHAKFGKKAAKCKPPCAFDPESKN